MLVVDDEEDTRSMISEVLSSRGYDVLAVASGFQALDALKSNSFDLVLLDVLMQGMDGFETLRRIRELDSITYLPVILVTALDASHRDFGIDLGADDYITKPYRIEDLLSRIRVGLRIKKLQDRLVEDKRRMAHIVENAFDAFFSLDADGLLSPLNARCSALFRDGVSADSRISFHSLLAPSEHDRLSTFIANALAGKKSASDFSLTDGRVIRIFSAPSAGEQILNCLARDVTEEARAAEELSSRARMLEDKVTVLNEGMRDSFRFESIISRNARMQAMFSLIRRISGSTATVLITGETGTGKELVAKAVHYNSPVSNGPFVKVDCGALSPGLLESELFGHIRGSFTGAIRDKAGRFEIARGGTIFLDEIANLPAEIQTRLLRVLQDGSFEPVGSNKTV
ncbi:MAG: sigma 54-interacting transcriptional regulator, partial [Candidatus Brocadiia bacterium]